MHFGRESWPALLGLMDEWLDLPEDQRGAWLLEVERTHPKLAPALREVLRQPPSGFLDKLPELTGNPAADEDSGSWLRQGELAGPYRLERELGRGGMGVVWLASRADGSLDRDVALKFPLLYSADQSLAGRFARERDILARLEDARIARLYDAGVTAQGHPYLALELVEGEPITAYCDRLRLGLRARLKLFLEVLRAVEYAHANLVIHRDPKPANMMVTKSGEVRLLDFGIARLLEQDDASDGRLTRAGSRLLTPEYASPEQMAGNAVTTATDIYSLGILLYELLTGGRPFRQPPASEMAGAAPTPPSAAAIGGVQAEARGGSAKRLGAAMRGDLDTIVLKAIQAEPRDRFGTVDAFAQDIERYLDGQPILARPESAWYRARKFVLRNKPAVAAVAAMVVSLAVGGGVAWRQKLRADREADTAQAVSEFLQNDLLSQAGSETQAAPGRNPDPEIKVRTALDRAAARLPGKFAGRPVEEAAIRQTIGDTYVELGLYAQAEPQMLRALDLRRRALGDGHADTLHTMQTLADLYQREGKYDAGEAMARDLIAAERRLGRANGKEAIAAMITLADIAGQGRADYVRAESLNRQVLAVEQRVLGESDRLTLATMNNLAAVLTREAKYAQAEEWYRQLIAAKRRVLGADHPDTLASMNGLGVLYRNEGKYAEAEAALKPALEGRRRAEGPEHRDTLASMNGLGLLYSIEGRYGEGEPLLTAAAATAARVLGEDNPDAQSCLNNLAELYRRENKLKESEAAYQRLLAARLRTYGPDNPFTANTLGGLGEAKLQLGKWTEATSLLSQADAHYRKHRVEVWRRYYVECLLGESLSRSGRTAEGVPLLASAYRTLLQKKGAVPPESRPLLEEVAKWAPGEPGEKK